MELVKKIIAHNKNKYEHLCYYELLIDKVEKNIESNPDIAIEICKSLIEGISKFILEKVDTTYNKKQIDSLDFHQLCKKLLDVLSEYNGELETDFIRKSVALMNVLSMIRNKRADISHGKLAPKEQVSSIQLAKFAKLITEGIVFYVLDSFLSIDLSHKEVFNYDDNLDFNQMLDEVNPMPLISLSYSKALFDQEKETYLILLDDYNLENNLESE